MGVVITRGLWTVFVGPGVSEYTGGTDYDVAGRLEVVADLVVIGATHA